MDQRPLLIEIKNLKTYFFLDEGVVRAVNGVDLHIREGETLGVVGESGCGKSITAQSILRLVPRPGKLVEGEILFHRPYAITNGSSSQTLDLAKLDPRGRQIRDIRGNEISMVFQEPMTALSPVYTIGNQIIEAIQLHQNLNTAGARELAIEMLDRVGIPQPQLRINDYPFQFSGGMRQRAVIAMALSCNPRLLIADEPTTALDVTTQAQILDLMRHIQEEMGMAILFITHDLGVIAEMTDRVAVMYLGRVVEEADVETIFRSPKHPYTRALMRSIPRMGRKRGRKRLETIQGTLPDPYSLPQGCPFHPRCPDKIEGICDRIEPQIMEIDGRQRVRCHLYV